MNSSPSDNPRYMPTNVQDVSDYDPVHGQVRAKRVNFRLHDGTSSYVVIPLTDYTRENVEKHLQAAADKHDEVMSIRGQPMVGTTPLNISPWSETK